MTNNEWNAISDFLETAEIGDYVEYDGRSVEVVNMAGGKFLHFDEKDEVAGLVNEIWKSCQFLKTGKVYAS